jgi:hypothetical protein
VESKRLETLERQLKHMERRIRGVVAEWILSVAGCFSLV